MTKFWESQIQPNLGFLYHYNATKELPYSTEEADAFAFSKYLYKFLSLNHPVSAPINRKKIKVLSWLFIEIFPKFDQKSPTKCWFI